SSWRSSSTAFAGAARALAGNFPRRHPIAHNGRVNVLRLLFAVLPFAILTGCSSSSHHPQLLGDCIGDLCPPGNMHGGASVPTSSVGSEAGVGEGGTSLDASTDSGGGIDDGATIDTGAGDAGIGDAATGG